MDETEHNQDGFRDEYFAPLAEVEAGHFWFRSRNRLLIWAFRRYFPQAKTFFEIGCGGGNNLVAIHQACPSVEISGSDSFGAGLQVAAARLPDIRLYRMDARRLPFRSEFDTIGAFDVLEHIEEDEMVLRQIFRALKPAGGLIVTVPQHRFLWSQLDEYSCHKRRYSRIQLTEKLKNAGFQIERVTSFMCFTLPLMFLSRLRLRRSRAQFDPLMELRVRPWMNSGLEKILGVERYIIERGLFFPAGGSLLAIGRRP